MIPLRQDELRRSPIMVRESARRFKPCLSEERFMLRFIPLPLVLLAAIPCLALSQDSAQPDRALIVVKLPADATLTIDGEKTVSTGAVRRFSTPQLEAGKRYYYLLVATWKQDGKEQKQEKKASFSVGETVEVVFTPAKGETGAVDWKTEESRHLRNVKQL